jgi:hypothetical protein
MPLNHQQFSWALYACKDLTQSVMQPQPTHHRRCLLSPPLDLYTASSGSLLPWAVGALSMRSPSTQAAALRRPSRMNRRGAVDWNLDRQGAIQIQKAYSLTRSVTGKHLRLVGLQCTCRDACPLPEQMELYP